MKSKKLLLIVVLLCLTCMGWSTGIDVVVMVDISESMFPVFDDVVNYLLRDLLENRLHGGDSFHLLSFADTPEEEVRIDIEDDAAISTVVDRILLLEPLGQYTDLIAAVEYLYEYTRRIPEQNTKLILLLTDGIHDPPPGSPNQLDEADAVSRLFENSEKIKREGWDIHILRMPGAEATLGAAASSDPNKPGLDLLDQLSEQLDTEMLTYEEVEKESLTDELTGFSRLSFPDPLGRIRRRFSAAFGIQNNSSEAASFTLVKINSEEGALLRRSVSVVVPPNQRAELVAPLRLPRVIEAGKQSLGVTLEFTDPDARISPLQGRLDFEYTPRIGWPSSGWRVSGSRIFSWPLPYLLYALAALILVAVIILLVFVIRHRMQESTFDRLFAGVAATRRRRHGIRPLIMKVESQNPNIGTRNIHSVPPGSRRSVGGDGSTFLIYYIPMPKRIGEIRNDGKQFSFVPKKPEHFPELSEPLADCLDKPIRAISSRGREITFHFHQYVSPLEELNRLMRSVPKYHIGDVPLKQPPPDRAEG